MLYFLFAGAVFFGVLFSPSSPGGAAQTEIIRTIAIALARPGEPESQGGTAAGLGPTGSATHG